MGDDRNIAHWHIRQSQGTPVSLCIAQQRLHYGLSLGFEP